MTYMQTCFGFFIGYLIIAHVLLPLYYRFGLTSIYTYLEYRIGKHAYKTGASFSPSVQNHRSRSTPLSGMPYPPALCIRRLSYSFRRHGDRDCLTHLAIHPPQRHTHDCVDGQLADTLPAAGAGINTL